MRVLLTGAAGYIGSVLTGHLLNANLKVTALDNFMYNNYTALLNYSSHPNFNFIKDDIRNFPSKLFQNFDCIIPLIALVGEPCCRGNEDEATSLNFDEVKRVCDHVNGQRIIYPNTNSGYGIGLDKACTEKSPLNPISHYGKTKVEAEKCVLSKPNGVSLRLATVCGSSPRFRRDLLFNTLFTQLYYHNEVDLFEGNFRRNFCHVQDIARAFKFFVFKDQYKGIYNCGNDTMNMTKGEMVVKIDSFLNMNAKITQSDKKDLDQRDYLVSNEKIMNTGFTFKYDCEPCCMDLYNLCKMLKWDDIKKMGNV